MSLNALREMLNPDVICGLNTTDPDCSTVTLVEDQNGSKLDPINLIIPTHDCLVFQLDKPNNNKFKTKSNFLHANKSGIHQACDYVVVCKYRGKLQFVFIELKSNETKGAASQLWHTTPFVFYLKKLLEIHYPSCLPNISDCVFKYLLFSTNPLDKLKTSTIYKPPTRKDKRGFTIHLGSNPINYKLDTILRA